MNSHQVDGVSPYFPNLLFDLDLQMLKFEAEPS